jgi:hypothetical protein
MTKIDLKLKINDLLWLVTIGLLITFHFNHPLDNDNGLTLEGALNIFNQREIYKDFFEFAAPGVFYLIAFAWKIFGLHYFIAKGLAILGLFMSALGIYKISQNIANHKLNAIGPLIFVLSSAIWPIITAHVFNLAFMIWASFFLLRGLDTKKYPYFILSGLFCGLSTIFMQSKGVLLMGAIGSFLFILSLKDKHYFKQIAWFCVSAIFPILILFIKWTPLFLYQQLVEFPLHHYFGLPNLTYSLLITISLWILTIILLLAKTKNTKIYLLIYIQILLLLSTITLPDDFHINLTLFPSIALIAIIFYKISSKSSYQKIIFNFIIIFGLVIVVKPAFYWHQNFKPFINSSKNNIVLNYIKDNCGNSQYIYAGPFLSTIYFETRLQNATSFAWLITNHHSPEQFATASKQLAENKPLCAVLNYSLVKKYNYDQNNSVDNYIFKNYHLIDNFGNTQIYILND